MADNPCVITLNGSDYYYPCDRKDDLVLIGDALVNVSSSQIILYKNISNDGTAVYPRVYCPTYTRAYYKSSSTSSNAYLTINSLSFKSAHYGYSVYIMLVILGVMICQLFKR